MKKILLTIITSFVVLSCFAINLSADEKQVITKEYLIEELNMNDDQIIGAGLGFVYDVGDVVTLHLHVDEEIDAGNNVTLTKTDEPLAIRFDVAGKGFDGDDQVTLIANDFIVEKIIKLHNNSQIIKSYDQTWTNDFLNTTVYNLFEDSVKSKIVNSEKLCYELIDDGDGSYKSFVDEGMNSLQTKTITTKLWIPSVKEVGGGNSFESEFPSGDEYSLPTLGNCYPLYTSSAKTDLITYNGQMVGNYYLREEAFDGEKACFTSSNADFSGTKTSNGGGCSIIFGMNVKFAKDLMDGVEADDDSLVSEESIPINAYTPSTYIVELPESISLTGGYTQFNYKVSGEIDEKKNVKVEFPQTTELEYDGVLNKDTITLNIFNEKISYDYLDCLEKGTTSVVTIQNEVPRVGSWHGNLDVTISLENVN